MFVVLLLLLLLLLLFLLCFVFLYGTMMSVTFPEKVLKTANSKFQDVERFEGGVAF